MIPRLAGRGSRAPLERVAARQAEYKAAFDEQYRDDPVGRRRDAEVYERAQEHLRQHGQRVLAEDNPDLALCGELYQTHVLIAALADIAVGTSEAELAAG